MLSLKQKAVFSALLVLVSVGMAFALPRNASAEYLDHNLIEEQLFLDAASMSQQNIQTFLEGRGGYIATYNSWSDRDNANVLASQIIYEAAQDYGISPKVLLATLQKEQSLVTAKNPTQSQLNFAMGYGCPDSTGCGTTYKGFYKQVDNASWQLRYNFERARGNNTWWRASSSYACGGTTRYYSTGLYVGRYVTFYDDYGTGYKSFTIANAATASLYCYTPHVYPGSQAQYYSGSYNFVGAYENWFGSTHAAVMITTSLQLSQDQYGATHTGVPVRASFTITNGTNNTVDLGSMAVAGYDSAGNNVGFPLQKVVMPAHTTYVYSMTQTFSSEDTYNFWITNQSPGGVWRDDYPATAGVSVTRTLQRFVQAMPQITVGPTVSADPRTGKASALSFTVHNGSTRTVQMGKMALAVYGPNGENYGAPLQSVSIPAGQNYVYNASQTWWETGTYTAWVTNTKDNGATWDNSFFPQTLNAQVPRRVNFAVKSNPTVTATPSFSAATPRAGQQVTGSFTLHNFSDSEVRTGGKVALAIYGPNGENVGLPLRDLTIAANGDLVYSYPTTFYMPGKYRAWITYFNGATYNNSTYPELESGAIQRSIEFTVKPSPTITVEPALSVPSPRAGQQVTASFTMHNYGSQTMNVGRIGLAIYGPNGENVGLAMQNMNVLPGSDQVYSLPTTFYKPGKYVAWITYYDGRIYNDSSFPAVESDSVHRSFEFTVKPSPTITVGPNFSAASPNVGQQVTAGFALHNYGTENINSGKIGLAIYGPNGENVGLALDPMVMTAGNDMVYSKTTTFTKPGTYTAWVTYYNGHSYNDSSWPEADSTSIARKITFTVIP